MSKRTPPTPKVDHIEPAKIVWGAMSLGAIGHSGSDDYSEGVEGFFDTEEEAVECLKAVAENYVATEGYVYQCIPTKRVSRGDVKVFNVTIKKPR